MKKQVFLLLVFITILLVSCKHQPAMNREFKEDVDTFFFAMALFIDIFFLGLLALGLSLGYRYRKKDQEGLKVASIIILALFTLFFIFVMGNYPHNPFEHPWLAGELLFSLSLIVFSIILLVQGVNRKKEGFLHSTSVTKSTQKTEKTTQMDEEVPPDEEIY